MGPLVPESNLRPAAFLFLGRMMPTEYIRAYRADDQQSDDGPVSFIASTEIPARDGMVIAAEGWDLKNFKRNPVMLWAHDWFGTHPPIGRVEARIDKDAKVLRADVTFDRADAFAADIERKYREGFLNAVSVGFDIIEINGKGVNEPGAWVKPEGGTHMATKTELLELSGVPIPADPLALAERHKRGMADLSDILRSLSDPEPTASPSELVWAGAAALMARCYLDTSDDDGEREAQYRRLAREYRALDKEPPEWMTRSQLSLLGDEEIRGLFLCDEGALLGWEPDVGRKGAVLSARNMGDLDQIIALAQGIKERATKEAEEPSEEDAKRAFLSRFYSTSDEPDDLLRRLAG